MINKVIKWETVVLIIKKRETIQKTNSLLQYMSLVYSKVETLNWWLNYVWDTELRDKEKKEEEDNKEKRGLTFQQ